MVQQIYIMLSANGAYHWTRVAITNAMINILRKYAVVY